MSLAAFLLARIAEDEAVARAALPSRDDARWRYELKHPAGTLGPVWNGTGQAVAVEVVDVEGRHIARHDPTRVLAECEAKRRIVEAMAAHDPRYDYRHSTEDADAAQRTLLAIGQAMATVYADHPDYREEWRP